MHGFLYGQWSAANMSSGSLGILLLITFGSVKNQPRYVNLICVASMTNMPT